MTYLERETRKLVKLFYLQKARKLSRILVFALRTDLVLLKYIQDESTKQLWFLIFQTPLN